MIAHVRELLGDLQRNANSRFRLLLEKVVYSGIHSGDSISDGDVLQLLTEVNAVLKRTSSLDSMDKNFFTGMKQLCEASIATGNPIVF